MDDDKKDGVTPKLEQFVTVDVLGQQYTFKTEYDELKAEKVASILVDEVGKIERQVSASSSLKAKQTILILAALNIASKHCELKRKYSKLEKDIMKRSNNLIKSLDIFLR